MFFDCAQVAGFAGLFCCSISSATCALQAGSCGGESRDEGVLGRKLHAGSAEDRVDARGEDADARCIGLLHPVTRGSQTCSGSTTPARKKSTSVPSLRPIQLRCMVRTFSGQPSSLSRPSSSSSA